MPKDRFLWNARHNGSVRASRIRNFTIDEDQGTFLVTAWVDDSQSVRMGIFHNEEDAKNFLEKLHSEIWSLNG